jgi:hypothetical protein
MTKIAVSANPSTSFLRRVSERQGRRAAMRTRSGIRKRATILLQRDVLRDVMLVATKCGSGLTLRELSRSTGYGEASISAQLRHLRKREYGGYVVEKRRRFHEKFGRGAEQGPVWEYQLPPGRLSRPRRRCAEPAPAHGPGPRRA